MAAQHNTLPQHTDEQRKEFLAKAAEMRKKRAQLRKDLKEGNVSPLDLLSKAKDPVIGKMKVVTFLESLPGFGKARAASVMSEIGIAETRKVQGIGSRQLEELKALLSK
jgi:DNA uptake protein ComE-like DNA-binding protein